MFNRLLNYLHANEWTTCCSSIRINKNLHLSECDGGCSSWGHSPSSFSVPLLSPAEQPGVWGPRWHWRRGALWFHLLLSGSRWLSGRRSPRAADTKHKATCGQVAAIFKWMQEGDTAINVVHVHVDFLHRSKIVEHYLDRERVVVHRKAFTRGDLFNSHLRLYVLCWVLDTQNSRPGGSQLYRPKCHKGSLGKLDQTQNRSVVLLVGVVSLHRTEVQKSSPRWSYRFSHFKWKKSAVATCYVVFFLIVYLLLLLTAH